MGRVRKQHFTVAEYFALESVSDKRHHYHRGAFYVFEDDPPSHDIVLTNLTRALQAELGDRPCTALRGSRLYIRASELFTYTDLAVACSPLVFFEERDDTLTNPTLLVEVSSALGREYDVGEKFGRYKDIESLQEYAVVDSESMRVQCFRRDAGGWAVETFEGPDSVCRLKSLEAEVPLRRLYDEVLSPD